MNTLAEDNLDMLAKLEQDLYINIIRNFLKDQKAINREGAIKFFQILLKNEGIANVYNAKSIPIFLARLIDKGESMIYYLSRIEISKDARQKKNNASEITQILNLIET